MSKPHKDGIPISKISHTTVVTDFSNLEGEGKILYLNPKCVLVGLNNVPYTIFVTADFDKEDLIKTVGKLLYEVKQIILKPTFSHVPSDKRTFCNIPDWLLDFKKAELLKFECVDLDELWLFRDLPVQNIAFKKVKFDPTMFLNSINQFQLLNEITYDDSLNEDMISKIISIKPHIKFSYENLL